MLFETISCSTRNRCLKFPCCQNLVVFVGGNFCQWRQWPLNVPCLSAHFDRLIYSNTTLGNSHAWVQTQCVEQFHTHHSTK